MSQLAQATRAFCPRLNQSLKKRSMVSRPLPEPTHRTRARSRS